MNKRNRWTFKLVSAVAALSSLALHAEVPRVDEIGKPAIVVCGIGPTGVQIRAVHMDKIIFRIIDKLTATNPNDQPVLERVPIDTRLDIKVLDDPSTIADLKGKVLTFLGALNNPANRAAIVIDDVDYAVVCRNPDSAAG